MSDTAVIKLNLALSNSFHRYLIQHPEIMDKVPKSASIFFVSPKHPKLTRKNLAFAETVAKKYKAKCYAASKHSRGWKVSKIEFGKAGK